MSDSTSEARHRSPPNAHEPPTNHEPPRRAAGKRNRTDGLPPRPTRDVLARYPLIDKGNLCEASDDQAGDTDACFLDEQQRERTYVSILDGLQTMLTSFQVAIANVKLDKATQNDHFWNGFLEILFLSATGPLIGPIAGAIGRQLGTMAAPAAELGLSRTAWKLASAADPKALEGAVTVAFKGIRGQLAHSDGRPRDLASTKQFLSHLQSVLGPAKYALGDSVANMTDADMFVFLGALRDPEVSGVAAYEARVRALLRQFDDNRIGVLGNVVFGTREVAIIKKVKVKAREYVVLLESFGMDHSALALNGANVDESKPKMTMDSLVFVRLVERDMHGLATEEMKRRRGDEAVEYIDFNRRENRARAPWFADMYRAIKRHERPDDLGVEVGDDPFGLHLEIGSVDDDAR